MPRVIAAALAVFFLLAIASVGSLVLRFLAGFAAILGCLGLLVIVLSLLLLYRIVENEVSNLALLIGTGTWAWWYIVKKRREERALAPVQQGPTRSERVFEAIRRFLMPPPSGPTTPPAIAAPPAVAEVQNARLHLEPAQPGRRRFDSVAEAVDHRRRHRPPGTRH